LHEFTNYIPNSYESGCYSFQPQYQPNRLPNIEYKNIGTIRIPKNKYKKLEVTIDNDLFGKTYQYNDDYEHYEKYIDFKHTRYSITAARGPIGLQDAAEQYPATCGKIAAPIRQDSITAARGPIGLQEAAEQYHATCGKIAAPIRQDSITISCTFTGETESERINNMVQHYLLHKCVINTEIFGTYVFTRF
jgi:hypothetical protein